MIGLSMKRERFLGPDPWELRFRGVYLIRFNPSTRCGLTLTQQAGHSQLESMKPCFRCSNWL
jgi:hypothetical protein